MGRSMLCWMEEGDAVGGLALPGWGVGCGNRLCAAFWFLLALPFELNASVPQFSYMQDGNNNRTNYIRWLGSVKMKWIEKFLAQNKPSINGSCYRYGAGGRVDKKGKERRVEWAGVNLSCNMTFPCPGPVLGLFLSGTRSKRTQIWRASKGSVSW